MNKIEEALENAEVTHADGKRVFTAVGDTAGTRVYMGTKMVWAEPEVRGGKFGYAVRYADGYVSWSPKEAFEEAYRNINGESLSFGHAVELMKQGYRVQRAGWNGPGQWLALQTPDDNSKMRKPYIYISPVDGGLVPWLASQTDLLAEDWRVA